MSLIMMIVGFLLVVGGSGRDPSGVTLMLGIALIFVGLMSGRDDDER